MAVNNKTHPHARDQRELNHWKKEGEDLAKSKESNQWAIGDWLVAGDKAIKEKRFTKKEAYDAAQKATGMTRKTLYQFKYTSECFPRISTRVKTLSYGHHRLVAKKKAKDGSGFTPDERMSLLRYAADGGEEVLSVSNFAAYLRERRQSAVRRAYKGSAADRTADKLADALDGFLRSDRFTTLLGDVPTTAKRVELLNRLRNATADLQKKMDRLASAWRRHEASDVVPAEKAVGATAGHE